MGIFEDGIRFNANGQGDLLDRDGNIEELQIKFSNEWADQCDMLDANNTYEMYRAYNDNMSYDEVSEILDSNPGDVYNAYLESLDVAYDNAKDYMWQELSSDFESWKDEKLEELEDLGDSAAFEIEALEELYFYDALDWANVEIELPYGSFLGDEFHSVIVLKGGDIGYSYLDNPDEEATGGFAFLLKSQGYSDADLRDAIENGTNSKFLKSVIQELENCAYNYNQVCFLVEPELRQLIDWADGKGNAIDIDATDVMCGLADFYTGGGSILEIELEKPITIPRSVIQSFDVDYGKYSIDNVYGLVGSAYDTSVELV